MAQRILEQARPVTNELDRMIFQMETSLGKQHSVSPFEALYSKHLKAAAPAEEEKKAATSKPAAEKQPKGKK